MSKDHHLRKEAIAIINQNHPEAIDQYSHPNLQDPMKDQLHRSHPVQLSVQILHRPVVRLVPLTPDQAVAQADHLPHRAQAQVQARQGAPALPDQAIQEVEDNSPSKWPDQG